MKRELFRRRVRQNGSTAEEGCRMREEGTLSVHYIEMLTSWSHALYLSLYSLPSSQHQDRKEEMDLGVIQTGALQRRATRSSSIHNHHLYLVVNKIDHQFPENVEVFFFLYNTEDKGQQVSERYFIKVNKNRTNNRSHDDKQCALFTVSS